MKRFLVSRCPVRPPTTLPSPQSLRSSVAGGCVVLRVGLYVLALGALCAPAGATTYTWNANTTGDWSAAANWTPSGPPNDGDDAVITNSGASVILSSSSSNLASLTLSKTLTFTNWDTALTATNVTILTNGAMTLPAAFTNNQMSNRVWIVCSNLLVASGGSISTDGKGYKGGPVSGGNGNGPGYGQGVNGNWDCSGAGHGGNGGDGGIETVGRLPGGSVYDSTNAPTSPGSGGGSSYAGGVTGGSGGGAVLIEATGAVTVNGAINANGTVAGGDLYSAGGSGGSIYITCDIFAGTNGVVSAAGAKGQTYGGGGGGGRIAVAYNPASQSSAPPPSVRFSVLLGTNGPARWARFNELENYFGTASELGTLYFPDTNILDGTFMPHSGNLIIPNFTSWALNSLTISNGTLQLVGTGFITGSTGVLHMATGGVINCGGNLTLTNGGALYVYGAVTNSGTPDYGSLVSVTGDISIASNSWVYPYSQNTNGGSPLFRVRNLMIATNGGINANGTGFDRGGDGSAARNGLGPGYGYGNASYRPTGAGYGAPGGRSSLLASRGATYGYSNAPVHPGSSGGESKVGIGYMGARGGGLI
ncbi:MAG: hypothetical protein HYV36_03165, partial [Lentisphaerae bacterium]|nr:hypothetical protein [Lentisphaerota bacterium]